MQTILRKVSLFQVQTLRTAGFISIQRIILVVSILLLVSSTGAVVPDVAARSGEGRWGKIRSINTVDYNLYNPRGMVFSPDANAFLLWDPNDDVTGISLREDPVDMAGLNIPVEDASVLALENSSNSLFALDMGNSELEKIGADGTGRPDLSKRATRYDLNATGLRDVKGITFDPRDGRLFVLNTKGTQIVVITPDSAAGYDGEAAKQGRRFRRINLKHLHLGKLSGLAFNPQDGHLYSFQPADQELYEFTDSGELVSSYDLSSLELSSPQTLLFAPSGDNTDDPSNMNLFILDGGKTILAQAQPGQVDLARTGSAEEVLLQPAGTTSIGGQIVELALNAPVVNPAVATQTTTLVQTIDVSNVAWGDPPAPSSPDPAGVAYWPDHDTLLISDSEVEESNRATGGPPPWFVGFNIFESSLTGDLLDTCDTLAYTGEPTGITVNPLNNHIFISDDANGGHIFEIDLGADTDYCTDDDTVTTLELPGVIGNDVDAEGVAVGDNKVFIAAGIDQEVYMFDLGPNGVIGGGDDGPIISFDTNSVGIHDLEGIEYNPEAGTLFIASDNSSDDVIFEVTLTGYLIETYDVSELDILYGEPTGGHIPRSGLAYGPSSQNPAIKNLYLSSRMLDNGSGDPVQALENDGLIFEIDIGNTESMIRVIVDIVGYGTVNHTPGNPYTSGQVATLQPVANPHSSFSGWTGPHAAELSDNGDGTWELLMDGYKAVTANFAVDQYNITVSKAGTGSGTVTSTPAGIDCGTDCSQDYDYGTQVTLNTIAGAESRFEGWSGDPDCSDGVVIMTNHVSCTATFMDYKDLPPFVESITRLDPSPTSKNRVRFLVNFSKNVIGVDMDDFTLNTTGAINDVSVTSFSPTAGPAENYIFTVATGSGKGTLRLDLNSTGTDIQDLDGNPISGGYTNGQTYEIIGSLSSSEADFDGFVSESDEHSNQGGIRRSDTDYLIVGDDHKNRQICSILYFSTLEIPSGSTITSASLMLKRMETRGDDPLLSHGDLLVFIRQGAFSDNIALQIQDFQAAPSFPFGLALPNSPVDEWFTLELSQEFLGFIQPRGHVQFKLCFDLDDDDDGIADQVRFYSRDAAQEFQPQLRITWETISPNSGWKTERPGIYIIK